MNDDREECGHRLRVRSGLLDEGEEIYRCNRWSGHLGEHVDGDKEFGWEVQS